MRKWLILFFALSATTARAAPAWTWTDADGQVHYSDRPVPGARQIDLPGAQAFGGAAQPPARQPVSSGPTAQQQPAAPASYRTINIVSPTEQETLWNIGGTLAVRVGSDPALQTGHRFDLVLDGQRLNLNTANTQQTLTEVVRGSHTLQVIVIDPAGLEVMRSPPRNFIVQQTSVQNPNAPLARPPPSAPPRPTPKPAPR